MNAEQEEELQLEWRRREEAEWDRRMEEAQYEEMLREERAERIRREQRNSGKKE